jgi:hypothetical protein
MELKIERRMGLKTWRLREAPTKKSLSQNSCKVFKFTFFEGKGLHLCKVDTRCIMILIYILYTIWLRGSAQLSVGLETLQEIRF